MRSLLRIGITLFLLASPAFAEPHSLPATPSGDWQKALREENSRGGSGDVLGFLIVMSAVCIFFVGTILESSPLAEERKLWRRVAGTMIAGPPILFLVLVIVGVIKTIIDS